MRAVATGIVALTCFGLVIGRGHAQVPPLPPPIPPRTAPASALPQLPPGPGFVSTYEIVHTLREAGFDPLAPPLREGTIFVARATDYRGILMRVVLDARTGAIRDANRILPPEAETGPYSDSYDRAPYARGPYGAPYGPPPYDDAYGDDPDDPANDGGSGAMPPPYDVPPPAVRTAPTTRPAAGAAVPPLPRPRPAALATRQPGGEAKPTQAVPNSPPDKTPNAAAALPAVVPAPAASTAPAAPPPPAAPHGPPPSELTIKN